MNILFGILIFIMGTVFGSFFTLAVYRIPLGLDITHERSFCPNCNHKLGFKDLIPILSYVFLKGECRYCGNHIRIRYLLLEILSGLVFLFSYLSFNMNFPYFELDRIIAFIAFVMFYITIIIILGIDKENRKINKSVLLFGILTQFAYMLYLYILKDYGVYRYGMYLIIMCLLFIIDIYFLKKTGNSPYVLQIIMLLDYILMYVTLDIFCVILVLGFLYVCIYYMYKKIKFNFKDKPDILATR